MSTNQENTFTTSDIGIAAYLQMLGYKLLVCNREQGGRFYFEFSDEEQTCSAKSLEFLSSDFCRFDNNVRNLKKILFS